MIRKRRDGLQVQVYAGRDPLTGRKRYVSQQVPGQTKAAMREAKQVEAVCSKRSAPARVGSICLCCQSLTRSAGCFTLACGVAAGH
jgi:hypothetical protein